MNKTFEKTIDGKLEITEHITSQTKKSVVDLKTLQRQLTALIRQRTSFDFDGKIAKLEEAIAQCEILGIKIEDSKPVTEEILPINE